jgi:inhibitor of cysteine peptidase
MVCKRWGTWIGVLLMVLMVTAGCGSAGEISLDADDQGRRIELAQGQTLAIALESNPTTGYCWEVADPVRGMLEQVGEAEFQVAGATNTQLVGAGGTETFRFEAKSAGTGTLKLVYHRPWEQGADPLETFEVQVVVR